jgi:hypothetical protein
MIVARRMLVLLAGAGLLGPSRLSAAEPIAPKDFADLHALIKPGSGEEKWARIPWLASLWEARRRAAAEGKPILLWEMDGNPLGCT